MKRMLLLLLACVGCAKAADNIPTLQDDAQTIEAYYTVKLDAATRRLQRVYEASSKVPKDLPGSDEALRALIDARDKLVEARKIKDTVEKTRHTLTTEDKLADLQRLVEHEEHQYEEALEFINENLSEVESFEANALRNVAPATNAPAPASPSPIPEGAIP